MNKYLSITYNTRSIRLTHHFYRAFSSFANAQDDKTRSVRLTFWSFALLRMTTLRPQWWAHNDKAAYLWGGKNTRLFDWLLATLED